MAWPQPYGFSPIPGASPVPVGPVPVGPVPAPYGYVATTTTYAAPPAYDSLGYAGATAYNQSGYGYTNSYGASPVPGPGATGPSFDSIAATGPSASFQGSGPFNYASATPPPTIGAPSYTNPTATNYNPPAQPSPYNTTVPSANNYSAQTNYNPPQTPYQTNYNPSPVSTNYNPGTPVQQPAAPV